MKLQHLIILLTIIITLANAQIPAHAQEDTWQPSVTVLAVDGRFEFARPGWVAPQPLLAGTRIQADNLVYSADIEAVALVMCPDGRSREFLASELLPVDVLKCDVDPAAYLVGETGTQRLLIQRGGRQDPSIPYVIAPRATVVRSPEVTLRWHTVPKVMHYVVTVRGGDDSWRSPELTPEAVTQDSIALIELPLQLQPEIAYTVEICVMFEDLREGCTTDPGWNSGDVAFYYLDTPALNDAENYLVDNLGVDTPESLFARAVLFSQPILETGSGTRLGPYQDAIDLLNQLIVDHPGSALASAPDVHNLLGDLYGWIALPTNAERAYAEAARCADPGTEGAARAALGSAITTSTGKEVEFYSQALDHYRMFLSTDAFDQQLALVCGQAGGLCLEFPHCADRMNDCTSWVQGSSD